MLVSMTGFGRGEGRTRGGTITVEVRSVNHRYHDVAAHLPSALSALEDRLRERLKSALRRGRVHVSVTYRSEREPLERVTVNLPLLQRYKTLLRRLPRHLSGLRLQGEVSFHDVLGLPNLWSVETEPQALEALWRAVDQGLAKALAHLNAMRAAEGRAIARDLAHHLRTIEGAVARIERRAPVVVAQYQARLQERIRHLAPEAPLDQQRLATEVALFAQNADIAEEISRLRSHLQQTHRAIAHDNAAGRTLDFLAQELFREANTIGAKANDHAIAALTITIKSAIEKMREQIQNVE